MLAALVLGELMGVRIGLQYKEAEKMYKDLVASVDKLNTLFLKASRDELKDDEIKTIKPAFVKVMRSGMLAV